MAGHPSEKAQGDRSDLGRKGDSQLMACRRCRKQKLRCSKEKPSCKRCQGLSAVCTYPPPPDRKLLAAQRGQHDTARTCPESERSNFQEGKRTSNSIRECLDLQETATLPPEVARLLIEIYFSQHWIAPLLFHKPTFTSDYVQNKAADFVCLSIFAVASNFLRERAEQPHLNAGSVKPDISTLSAKYCSIHAREWATAGGQRVLLRADEPCLETIQACLNLAFYWFYLGDTDRTYFYTSNAYGACRLLHFHTKPANNTATDPLLREVRRRCFWSCWLVSCISQGNASFKAESWKEAVGLPLPSDEVSFLAGNPESKEAFANNGDIVSISGERDLPASIMGEFVKVFSLWWEIQHFVNHNVDDLPRDSLTNISALLALDRHLEVLWENLHPDFHYLGPQSFTDPKSDPCRLFSLHCIYHLCACVLHSSIVPVFSNMPSDPQISKKLTRMSAEEAIKHSIAVIDMATTFLNLRLDESRLSGVIGYALFVSSSVQFKSLSAQDKLRSQGTSRCNAAILILRRLKDFSRPLQCIWTNLDRLFSSARININNLSMGSTRKDGPSGPNTDIQQIVSQKAFSRVDANNIDLYTYVPNVEGEAASPRCDSASPNCQDNIPQAQAGASIPKKMMRSAVEEEFVLPLRAAHEPSPGLSTGVPNYYQPSAPQFQQPHAPPTQAQLFDYHLSEHQDLGSLAASSSGSPPPASVAAMPTTAGGVGYQMAAHGQGQVYLVDGMPTPMEIDGTNLWWDHRLEGLEASSLGFLYREYPWADQGNYFIPSR